MVLRIDGQSDEDVTDHFSGVVHLGAPHQTPVATATGPETGTAARETGRARQGREEGLMRKGYTAAQKVQVRPNMGGHEPVVNPMRCRQVSRHEYLLH